MSIAAAAAKANSAIAIAAVTRLPQCTNAIAIRVRTAKLITAPHLASLTADWLTMMRWRRASSALWMLGHLWPLPRHRVLDMAMNEAAHPRFVVTWKIRGEEDDGA